MKKMAILAASSALIFAACSGDETTNVTEVTESTGLDVVAKGEKMPACDTANVGQMIFVTDSSAVYYCADGEWTTLNGKDGEDGKSVKGEDGTSCTAKEVDEGIEVSCGDKLVGTIKNGKPGEDGEDLVSQNGAVSYFIDSRDGKQYKAVTIGTQTWMAENLNYAYLQPTVELDSSSFCYDNDLENCKMYGRLYLWSAAMDSSGILENEDKGKGCSDDAECGIDGTVQGICPKGWHLPSKNEFDKLLDFVGENADEKLKAESGWADGKNGMDLYGFLAIPAGRYDSNDKKFYYFGRYLYFWSSTEYNGEKAYNMFFDDDVANIYGSGKYGGYSVRCLKD